MSELNLINFIIFIYLFYFVFFYVTCELSTSRILQVINVDVDARDGCDQAKTSSFRAIICLFICFDLWYCLRREELSRNWLSCPKLEKLPKRCRASCKQPYI